MIWLPGCQAASGAGQAAMDELELQTKEALEGREVTKNIFPFQVGARTPCPILYPQLLGAALHVPSGASSGGLLQMYASAGYMVFNDTRAVNIHPAKSHGACCSTPSTCFRTTRR